MWGGNNGKIQILYIYIQIHICINIHITYRTWSIIAGNIVGNIARNVVDYLVTLQKRLRAILPNQQYC